MEKAWQKTTSSWANSAPFGLVYATTADSEAWVLESGRQEFQESEDWQKFPESMTTTEMAVV